MYLASIIMAIRLRFGPKIPTDNTSNYDKKLFATSITTSWDFFQSHVTGINLKEISFRNLLSINYTTNLRKRYYICI